MHLSVLDRYQARNDMRDKLDITWCVAVREHFEKVSIYDRYGVRTLTWHGASSDELAGNVLWCVNADHLRGHSMGGMHQYIYIGELENLEEGNRMRSPVGVRGRSVTDALADTRFVEDHHESSGRQLVSESKTCGDGSPSQAKILRYLQVDDGRA